MQPAGGDQAFDGQRLVQGAGVADADGIGPEGAAQEIRHDIAIGKAVADHRMHLVGIAEDPAPCVEAGM